MVGWLKNGGCKVYVENYDNDEEKEGSDRARDGRAAESESATECVLFARDVEVDGVLREFELYRVKI